MKRALLFSAIILCFIMTTPVFPSDYADALPKWLKLLEKGNTQEKKLALRNLWPLEYPELRKDHSVFDPVIHALLKDREPSVREAAAHVLRQIGDYSKGCCKETKIVPALINALEDKNPRVRGEAALALGYYKDERAVEPLIKTLKDQDLWVGLNSVFSLGEVIPKAIGVSAAKSAQRVYGGKGFEIEKTVHPLIELLMIDTSDWRRKIVQQEAVIAIRKIGYCDPKVIAALARKSGDTYLRAEVIRTLGNFGSCAVSAKDIILKAMEDPDERVRRVAVDALSKLPIDPAAGLSTEDNGRKVELYTRMLNDPSAKIRSQAVEGLGHTRDVSAVELLLKALHDSHGEVRQMAIAALENFQDERILDAMIPLLVQNGFAENQAEKTFLSVAEKTKEGTVYIYRKNGFRYVVNRYEDIPKELSCYKRMLHPKAVGILVGKLASADEKLRLGILEVLGAFEDNRSETYLIRFLDDPSAQLRQRSISMLRVIGGTAVVSHLIEALSDKDRGVREAAARALGEFQDKRALEPLIKRLDDGDGTVRAAALNSLSGFDDPRELDIDIKLLKDESVFVRRTAVRNIMKRPDKRAVESLLPLLNDPDILVADMATKTLGVIGDPRFETTVRESISKIEYSVSEGHKDTNAMMPGRQKGMSAMWERDSRLIERTPSGVIISPKAYEARPVDKSTEQRQIEIVSISRPGTIDINPLIVRMKDKNPQLRREAADTLGDIGDRKATKHVIPLLKDENEYVRQAAARALGKIKDQEAVEPLLGALKDTDIDVTAFAIWALGEIGDSKAIEPISGLLWDEEEKIRERSFEALRKFEGSDARKTMVNVLMKRDPEWMLQRLVTLEGEGVILKTFEDPEGDNVKTVRNYIVHMASGHRFVSDIVKKTLINHKDRGLIISEMTHCIKGKKDVSTCISFLGDLNDQKGIPVLIEVLKNRTTVSQVEIIFTITALGKLGGNEDVASELLTILVDDNEGTGVKEHAARTLGKLGDKNAVDPLIRILQNKAENKDVRIGASVALGDIKDKRGVEPLINIIKDHNEPEWLRNSAAASLGNIGDERAISTLQDLLKDPSGYVRNAAQGALTKIKKAR